MRSRAHHPAKQPERYLDGAMGRDWIVNRIVAHIHRARSGYASKLSRPVNAGALRFDLRMRFRRVRNLLELRVESLGSFPEARLEFEGRNYVLIFFDWASLAQQIEAEWRRGGIVF